MINISKQLKDLAISAPKPLYIVGGYVRDFYLGRSNDDIDICGAMPCEVMMELSKKLGYNCVLVNEKLGTMWITAPNGEKYECTPFRVENYTRGHSPSEVQFVDDIVLDAKRRDFSVNCIYYNILTGEVFDPYNGIKDAKKGVIKCVETPAKVFGSDGLRILRLVRFASKLGFKVDRLTLKTAREMAYMLKDISAERKLKELHSLVVADYVHGLKDNKMIELFNKLALYKYVFNLPINFKIKKDKYYKRFLALDKESRFVGFFVVLLINKYGHKYYPSEQMANDVRAMLGGALKASNLEVKQVLKVYAVVQDMLYKPLNTFLAVNYHNLSNFERDVVNKFVDAKAISLLILNMKNKNIPLSDKQLNVSNEELLKLVDEKYISAIRQKLFELCLKGKLINEKQQLIDFIVANYGTRRK